MRRWWWVVFWLLLFAIVIGYLSWVSGGWGFVHLQRSIAKLPVPERQRAQSSLAQVGERGAEWGILAGNYLGKVWVWGAAGLVSYPVDNNSVYSIFDGCSEEIKAQFRAGNPKAELGQEIINDYEGWQKRARTGEYVVVYKVAENQGGMVGNLKELHLYNFWPFWPAGIDRRCEK